MTKDMGLDFWAWRIFSTPQCPDWTLRDVKLFSMKLTNHLHLVLRLRMLETLPALPHLSSWDGAEFSQGQLHHSFSLLAEQWKLCSNYQL